MSLLNAGKRAFSTYQKQITNVNGYTPFRRFPSSFKREPVADSSTYAYEKLAHLEASTAQKVCAFSLTFFAGAWVAWRGETEAGLLFVRLLLCAILTFSRFKCV